MILLTSILECFWRKTNYLLDSLRARVRSIFLAIRDRWIEYSTGCNFWHPGVRGHVLLWSKCIRSHCLFLTSSDTGPDVISKYACTGPVAYFQPLAYTGLIFPTILIFIRYWSQFSRFSYGTVGYFLQISWLFSRFSKPGYDIILWLLIVRDCAYLTKNLH